MTYNELINQINNDIVPGIPKGVTAEKLKSLFDNLAQFANETRGDYQGTAAPADDPGTPTDPVYYIAGSDGTYTNFGGLIVTAADGLNLLSYVPGSGWNKTVVPIDLTSYSQKSKLGGILTPEATYNNNEDDLINFRRSFVDISLNGTKVDGVYYYIYSLVIDPLSADSISIFLGKNNSSSATGTISDLICSATISGITARTGIQKINLSQYLTSGFTGSLVIDFDILNKSKTVSITSSTFKNYTKMGLRPELVRKDLPTDISDIEPTQLRYAGKLLANKELLYPLVSVSASTITDNTFTRKGILDLKILNADRDSFYNLGYIANNHSTFKDCIVIRRYSRSTGDFIENVTFTDYRPVLTIDRAGIVVRELSNEVVTEQGFTGNFLNGLKILITIDYSQISDGAVWSTTSLNFGNRISDDCIYSFSELDAPAAPASELKSYFKKEGESLYIISKYDTGYDWQVRFQKAMFNDLYTFQRVGLVANTSNYVDTSKVDGTPDITLNNVGSDNIGPVNISGFGFIGANHSLNDDGITRTAENDSFKIFIDGLELTENSSGYFNEILVVVKNTLFNPSDLPSTETPFIEETVSYKIIGCSIDVTVSHKYLSSTTVAVYYGFQSLYSSEFSKIFYGHSANSDRIDYTSPSISDSGISSSYPNVEKMVLSSTDKTKCMSMTLNRSIGLGLAIPSNISGSEAIAFKPSSKIYFRLLSNKAITSGSRLFWNGCYHWFNQTNIPISSPVVHSYPHLRAGKNVHSVDFLAAGQHIAPYKIGQEIDVVIKDDGYSVDTFSDSQGVLIIASASGGCMIT